MGIYPEDIKESKKSQIANSFFVYLTVRYTLYNAEKYQLYFKFYNHPPTLVGEFESIYGYTIVLYSCGLNYDTTVGMYEIPYYVIGESVDLDEVIKCFLYYINVYNNLNE